MKGSGACKTRNSLLIGDLMSELNPELNENEINSLLEDNKLEVSEIDKLLNTSNREDLIESLENPSSFIEYIIAKYKLENKKSDIDFEDQNFKKILTDIKKNKLQSRALFAKDTLFKDHLLYISYLGKSDENTKLETETKNFYRFKINKSLNSVDYQKIMPKTVEAAKSNAVGYYHPSEIAGALNKLIQTKVNLKEELETSDYTIDMLKDNFEKLKKKGGYASYVNLDLLKNVEEKELENLFDYIKENNLVQKYTETRNFKKKTKENEENEDNKMNTDKYQLFADITKEQEDELKNIITTLDYKITNNELDVPAYQSWAKIKPGKRFSVDLGDETILHYVPHYSIGTDVKIANEALVKYPKITGHFANKLNKDLDLEYYNKDAVDLDDIYYVDYKYSNDDSKNFDKLEISTLRDEEIQKSLKEAALSGEPIIRDKSGKYERKGYIRKATKSDLEKFNDYMKPLDDKFIYHKKLEELEIKKTALKTNIKKLSEISFASASKFKSKEEFISSKDFKDSLESHYQLLGINDLSKEIQDKITDKIVSDIDFEYKEKKIFKDVPHNAPMSERGVLKIVTKDPNKALEKIKELRLSSDLVDKIPYKEIYHANNYKGRINPISNEYIINPELAPAVPAGNMVLHGMTGINNANEAKARMKRILKLGGLKSISERRRLNVKNKSLSPKGDIASGIDSAVPTKIGAYPSFGDNYVVFGMKPDVLKRRDVFFSNQDFGGGHNRYDSYNNYAKKIGQGKMHQVADNKARNNHLKTGLGGTNEACFKNEINMNEVDALFVKDIIFNDVKELIDSYKEKGEINQDLEVVSYTHDLGVKIKTVANESKFKYLKK